jgi:cytoskeletal protein RodZ
MDEPEEAIARCARIATVGDRILCLENALRSESAEAPQQTDTEESVEPAEVSVVDAPAEQPESMSPAATETAAAPEAMSAESASEKTDAAVAPQTAAVATGIGAEQVEARQSSRKESAAELASEAGLRVASYKVVPYERLVVELENGQVWLQIKGDTQRFRVSLERNQTVDISESRFGGGYQLRLNEMRRTIKVQRIK